MRYLPLILIFLISCTKDNPTGIALVDERGTLKISISEPITKKPPRPTTSNIVLEATALPGTKVRLDWTGGSSLNLVYRKQYTYSTSWIKIAETNSQTYLDEGRILPLYPGETYIYKIVSGRSESNPDTVTTLSEQGEGYAVILLDYDGHIWSGQVFEHSGLDLSQQIYITDSVTRHWNRVNPNLVVTTSEEVFQAGNRYRRTRNVFTVSWEWYGMAGGAASQNSFTSGTDIPCWIFTSLLNFHSGNSIRVSMHETGHTLGLTHDAEPPIYPYANWMLGWYGYQGYFNQQQIDIINSKIN